MANIAKLLTEHMDIWTAADTEKKSGRGRASGNASSVYGVKKLRELIFGLAISGKLLPQDPIDTSTQAVTKKLGLNRKVLNEDLLTEFELPSTWQWFCVSDLCDLKTGATPSTSVPAYYGGHIRWLVSGDIHGNEIYDCEGRITELGLSNSNCKILPENSILIALNGQGKTRATVAMLRCEAACNQSLVAMISKYNELILPEFILLNLKYRYTEIRDITGQNQRRGLNMGLVGDLSVSVPPLSEQHRIVAKVDELMALCEQLEQQHSNAQEAHENLVSQLLATLTQSQSTAEFNANWQRIYTHFDVLFTTDASIDALKQTLLQLAVMGKLVPQDPSDEPASELLKRIQAEKAKLIAEGKLKKEKPLAPISEDEKPFELPKGWEWLKFGELTALINGDRSKNYPNQSEYVESGIAWINTGHIRPDGTLSTTEMNFITKEKFAELRSGKIKEGDLVYCLRGATFGKTAFVKPYSIGAVASSLVIIRPYNLKLGEYIYKYLISPFGKSQVYRFDNGSAQPNLSANSVTLYAFPLPPLAEQHRIVAKVDALMALCDQLKTRITVANQLQQKLADVMVEQTVT
jgi:type I restriction enzyme S subunit